MSVWRIQKNTDTEADVAKYCLDNKVLAMGWSLKDEHLRDLSPDVLLRAQEKRTHINTIDDYKRFLFEFGIYNGRINDNVNRLAFDLCPDDLVWMRREGIYYLGRVTDESHWNYNASVEALNADASNQVSNIEWIEIGDESCVPGAIATSMIRGQTLRHIWKKSMLEYSQLLYNSGIGVRYYDVKLNYSRDTFYNLFSTEDCEDLLCLWLYHKFGYICIPSTNKKSTELYECVLLDPKTGRRIYPQAKAGKVDIYTERYMHLDGESWLFTTNGSVIGNKTERIKEADPEELFSFVENDSNRSLLPLGILKWYDFMREYK